MRPAVHLQFLRCPAGANRLSALRPGAASAGAALPPANFLRHPSGTKNAAPPRSQQAQTAPLSSHFSAEIPVPDAIHHPSSHFSAPLFFCLSPSAAPHIRNHFNHANRCSTLWIATHSSSVTTTDTPTFTNCGTFNLNKMINSGCKMNGV